SASGAIVDYHRCTVSFGTKDKPNISTDSYEDAEMKLNSRETDNSRSCSVGSMAKLDKSYSSDLKADDFISEACGKQVESVDSGSSCKERAKFKGTTQTPPVARIQFPDSPSSIPEESMEDSEDSQDFEDAREQLEYILVPETPSPEQGMRFPDSPPATPIIIPETPPNTPESLELEDDILSDLRQMFDPRQSSLCYNAAHEVILPAFSGQFIEVQWKEPLTGMGIIEPYLDAEDLEELEIVTTLADTSQSSYMEVRNHNDFEISIPEGAVLGVITSVDEDTYQ
ncbi:unnamed protein product, partial [Owenia fusiformis]